MGASVVDLFCGIGGLSHGFRKEKFNVIAGFDTDDRCRYAYEINNDAAFHHRDVASLSGAELSRLYPAGEVRVLAGCAPCQPFSLYRNGKSRGEKWRLLREFARLTRLVQPDVLTMENVPQLVHHRVFREFVRQLEEQDYWTTWYLARGPLYGIPQRRTRLVLFASRLGAVKIIPPTHSRETAPTVWDAIGRLEPISAGGKSKRDSLHRARNLSEINQRRIAATQAGGWWRDWDESLRLACHMKESGKTYRTVYGRMDWGRQAPTITTLCIGLGNGQFGHPEQDRAMSLREAALLQTFPRRYRFVEPRTRIAMQTVALHLGNAVPVRLGRIIARSIRQHLQECGAI
jgi:DNA (cytosine-5)-methyltransferase 1